MDNLGKENPVGLEGVAVDCGNSSLSLRSHDQGRTADTRLGLEVTRTCILTLGAETRS
jgi:hypothetical protein